MRIAVCVKQVPDTWAQRRLNPEDKTLDRESVDGVVNELDEYAIEEALLLAEANGGEVVVVTVGPEKAADTIRKALAMGADSAIHVCDRALHGSDALGTSLVLSTLVKDRGFDLVVFGSESTDARMSVVPAMVAERLGEAQLTFATRVEVAGNEVRIRRQEEHGYDEVTGSTPAVVSVVEKINEPRYPSFKGIMAAKKKVVETVTLQELGIAADQVGLAGAASSVEAFENAPPREAGTVVTDAGDGGVKIAEFLSKQKFI